MNAADLFDKIRDRAAADTGSGGLFNVGTPLISGFYYHEQPSANSRPYCVFFVSSDTDRSMFTQNMSEVLFSVATIVSKEDSSIGDPVQRGSDIMKRVYGDSASGSLTPTYGFHRWQPTLGDWSGTQVQYVTTGESHGDGYLQWIQQFKLWAYK